MGNDVLTKNQTRFLNSVGTDNFIKQNFYLTGGTALTAFYLRHRYSEDLDFFSEKEVDLLALNVFFEKFKKDLGISRIDFQQSFNRNLFFLHLNGDVLKTEFTFFPFTRIEAGKKEFGITVDSALDIAVNKLFTIYQRSLARDYIDLYFICRQYQWGIDDLIAKAKIKFDWHIDPLQLGTQFIKAQEASDYPRMIKEVSSNEWRGFFTEEARKLRPEIIE